VAQRFNRESPSANPHLLNLARDLGQPGATLFCSARRRAACRRATRRLRDHDGIRELEGASTFPLLVSLFSDLTGYRRVFVHAGRWVPV
jgi:hypothetical protein